MSTPSTCEISMNGLSGSYKLTSLQYRANGTTAPVDYLSSMEDCEKDDILVLKNNGMYEYNDLGTACKDSEPEHGTWTVKGNTLSTDGTLHGTISSYDCKTMVYYIDDAIVKGDRIIFTMTKQ